MVAAYNAYSVARGLDKEPSLERWQRFLFMFSCVTLHELAHLFICYLSSGPDFNTPPGVSYLNYGPVNTLPNGTTVYVGESGRWLENALYGGSIEFFTEPAEGPDQVFSTTLATS